MVFEQICKNIINENKKEKQLIVNGQHNKPKLINEKDQKENKMSSLEQVFMKKFIKFIEIQYIMDAYEDINKECKQIFPKESLSQILDIVKNSIDEKVQKLKELKTELKTIRKSIKDNNKNNKLNIISLLDSNIINESVEVDEKTRVIDLDLPDTPVNKEIIESVFGQISDGIWENSPRMEGYWYFEQEVVAQDGKLFLLISSVSGEFVRHRSSNFLENPYYRMSDEAIVNFVANKIKQIVYEEFKDNNKSGTWQRNDQTELNYLGYHARITVSEAYKAYDILKGRIRPESDYIKSDLTN